MLSLILALMLSIGGSPAGVPGNTGIQAPIDNSCTINRIFEDYSQKTASRLFPKKIPEIVLIDQPKTQIRLIFTLPLKEKLYLMGYEDSMNLYQAFNMNPINFTDPWGLRTDFNYFGTKKTFAEALNYLVVTSADKRQLGRVAEGGANIVPAIIYFIQNLAEVVTGEDYFEEDWRFRFNFSGPGSIIQLYPTEERTYLEKVRDATVVYPTGKFLADTGSDFILGYNDPYVMNTPVGQEARENFDRDLVPLAATGYGVYKGICSGSNLFMPKNTKGQTPYNLAEPYATEAIYSAEFQQWLTKGEKNVGNYIGNDPITGEPVYTGITNNFKVRQNQWEGVYKIEPINEGNLFRNQARCIEQVIKVKNPGFKNINNSINPNRAIYNEALNWGKNWLKSMGIL